MQVPTYQTIRHDIREDRNLQEQRCCNALRFTARFELKFYILLTVHLGIILVNNQLDAHFFSVYVYFDTLHISSNHVFIIMRINCINTTSGVRHSMYVNVWYAGMDGTPWSSIHTCIRDGHLRTVTCARCRIDTTDSPDDERVVARNMQSIEINIHGKEMCVKLVIYKNY